MFNWPYEDGITSVVMCRIVGCGIVATGFGVCLCVYVLQTHRGDLSVLFLPGINPLGLQSLQHFMQSAELKTHRQTHTHSRQMTKKSCVIQVRPYAYWESTKVPVSIQVLDLAVSA